MSAKKFKKRGLFNRVKQHGVALSIELMMLIKHSKISHGTNPNRVHDNKRDIKRTTKRQIRHAINHHVFDTRVDQLHDSILTHVNDSSNRKPNYLVSPAVMKQMEKTNDNYAQKMEKLKNGYVNHNQHASNKQFTDSFSSSTSSNNVRAASPVTIRSSQSSINTSASISSRSANRLSDEYDNTLSKISKLNANKSSQVSSINNILSSLKRHRVSASFADDGSNNNLSKTLEFSGSASNDLSFSDQFNKGMDSALSLTSTINYDKSTSKSTGSSMSNRSSEATKSTSLLASLVAHKIVKLSSIKSSNYSLNILKSDGSHNFSSLAISNSASSRFNSSSSNHLRNNSFKSNNNPLNNLFSSAVSSLNARIPNLSFTNYSVKGTEYQSSILNKAEKLSNVLSTTDTSSNKSSRSSANSSWLEMAKLSNKNRINRSGTTPRVTITNNILDNKYSRGTKSLNNLDIYDKLLIFIGNILIINYALFNAGLPTMNVFINLA